MSSSILDWFIAGGGKLHPSIEVWSDPSDGKGYRLRKRENAPGQVDKIEDQTIVSLPFALCFSILQIPEIAPWWPVSWIDQHNSTILTRFLLIEAFLRDTDHFFTPYIRCLPSPYGDESFHTPLFWTDTEVRHLEGTNLHQATISRIEQWRNEFEDGRSALLEACPSRRQHLEGWNYDLYRWAATVLTTRCFPGRLITPPDGHAAVVGADLNSNFAISKTYREWCDKRDSYLYPVLLPVLDFANHDPAAEVTWQSTGSCVELKTGIPMDAGVEIFNNYGQKSNEELILGYGFDLPGNAADHVGLAVRVGDSAKIKLIRIAQEKARAESSSTSLVGVGTSLPDAGQRIYALRYDAHPLSSPAATPLAVLAMNTRELRLQCRTPFSTPVFAAARFPSHLSVACAAHFYAKLCDDRAKIDESGHRAEIEEANDKGNHTQMALRYRRSQIKILDRAITMCGKTLEAWKRTGRLLCLEDILTGFLPSSTLREYRKVVHRVIGSRDAQKIITKGLDELAFVLWILMIIKSLENVPAPSSGTIESDGVITTERLQTYIGKLVRGYGAPSSAENHAQADAVDEIEKACLDEKRIARIEKASERYEGMVRTSGIVEEHSFDNFNIVTRGQTIHASLAQTLWWAVRVFDEEWVLLGSCSLDPEGRPVDSDEDELLESFIIFEDDEDSP